MSLKDVPTGKRLRYLRLMLTQLCGRGGGFFIPYRYADGVDPKAPIAGPIVDAFTAADGQCLSVIESINAHANDLARIGHDAPAPQPRWGQDWFPGLDAAAYYSLIRTTKPAQIVEIGSGHSTRFAAQAIRDGGLNTQIIAIDPAPRAAITEELADIVTCRRTTVENLPTDQRPVLAAGDILFIDSSHIMMPGSDVDHLFTECLPSLPPGVLIHIHDIFLPAPYPAAWRWRGYNEQPLVAALIGTGSFEIVFGSAYCRAHHADRLEAIDRIAKAPKGAHESSLWLRRKQV